MNYAGMPMGMWALFQRSFTQKLVSVLGYTDAQAVAALVALAVIRMRRRKKSKQKLSGNTGSSSHRFPDSKRKTAFR